MFISYVNLTSLGLIYDRRTCLKWSGLFKHQIISKLCIFFNCCPVTFSLCLKVSPFCLFCLSLLFLVSFCLLCILFFLCAHRRSPDNVFFFSPVIHLYCRKCYLIINTHFPLNFPFTG